MKKLTNFTKIKYTYSFIWYATTPSSLYTSGSEGQTVFACMKNWNKKGLSNSNI